MAVVLDTRRLPAGERVAAAQTALADPEVDLGGVGEAVNSSSLNVRNVPQP